MRKTIKISMILLLMGLTGTTSLAAKEIAYNSTDLELVKLLSDSDKEKKEKKAKAEEAVAGKPFFRTFENQVSVNLLNLDRNPVHVQVLDANDRVLFKEVIKGEHTIGKQFDFSEVENGVYTIVIKDCENQYYKKVEKY